MSRSGQRITLQALTPLTNTDSSPPPPGKLASPQSMKSSYETMHTSAASLAVPSGTLANGTDTITPINTPPETRISIFPSDGVLGQRITYDPLLDSKLDKKARQSRPPTYKQILDKV